MKQTNMKRTFLAAMEGVVRKEVEKNNSGQSFCCGIFHQPKRPKRICVEKK